MKENILLFALLFVILRASNQSFKTKITGIKDGTITNLYDAFSKDSSLRKDFGFSCITKYKGKTILFDAGSNAEYLVF